MAQRIWKPRVIPCPASKRYLWQKRTCKLRHSYCTIMVLNKQLSLTFHIIEMLDGGVNVIERHGYEVTMKIIVTHPGMYEYILGRDHDTDLYLTTFLSLLSTASVSSWRKITANGIDIICTPDQLFLTTTGFKESSSLTTSDFVYGLSGTNMYDFGPAADHVTVQGQYKSLFTNFQVTANISHIQTATSYGLRTTVGKYFANRFVVRDEL